MNADRTAALFAACALVVLAGCAGAFGGASEESGPPAYATESGELNATALERAHTDALLEAGSYTQVSTAEVTYDGDRPDYWFPNQTIVSKWDREAGAQSFEQEVESQGYVGGYANGTRGYQMQEWDGETEYAVRELDRSDEEFAAAMREQARVGVPGLSNWNFEYDGTAERDGETLHRFTADEFDGQRQIPDRVVDANATVLATDEGVVRHIDLRFAGQSQGESVTVRITIAYEDAGETTVEAPDWVDEAARNAS